MSNPAYDATDTSVDAWESWSVATIAPADDAHLSMGVSIYDYNGTARITLATVLAFTTGAKHDFVYNGPFVWHVTSFGVESRYIGFEENIGLDSILLGVAVPNYCQGLVR